MEMDIALSNNERDETKAWLSLIFKVTHNYCFINEELIFDTINFPVMHSSAAINSF